MMQAKQRIARLAEGARLLEIGQYWEQAPLLGLELHHQLSKLGVFSPLPQAALTRLAGLPQATEAAILGFGSDQVEVWQGEIEALSDAELRAWLLALNWRYAHEPKVRALFSLPGAEAALLAYARGELQRPELTTEEVEAEIRAIERLHEAPAAT